MDTRRSRYWTWLAVAVTTVISLTASGGEVSLSWNMPTNTLDGALLTDLAGAKVYYGVSSSNYTTVIDVGYTNTYTVKGLQEGETYYLNGTAYNASGLESDFCAEAVKVAQPSSGNEAPQVNAGPDLVASLLSPVAINGTVTDDGLPQGSTLVITWSKVQGPGTATFADEHAVDTSATFSAPGQYTLRLQATDGEYTASDEMLLTINPRPAPSSPRNLRIIP